MQSSVKLEDIVRALLGATMGILISQLGAPSDDSMATTFVIGTGIFSCLTLILSYLVSVELRQRNDMFGSRIFFIIYLAAAIFFAFRFAGLSLYFDGNRFEGSIIRPQVLILILIAPVWHSITFGLSKLHGRE